MLDREDLDLDFDPPGEGLDDVHRGGHRRASRPAAPPEPAIIVAPQRPSTGSAKLLPPILILMLGVGFLGYRSLASDWRGISAFFDPVARTKPPTELAALPKAEAEAVTPSPAPAGAKPEDATPRAEPSKSEDAKPAAKAPEGPDPLADIEREAEATKARIAELERLKEAESKKLDETADERKQADQLAQQNRRGRFRAGGPANAQQFEAMIAQQREILKQQMAWMEQMHERHRAGMAEMEQRFRQGRMGGMGPGMFPGFAAGPDTSRFRTIPPGMMGMPPGGVAKFREFRGPNGMMGFEMRWESGNQAPPLPPGPGGRDGEVDAREMGRPGVVEDVNPDAPPPPPRPAAPRRAFD